jgi:MFS family permease
MLDILRIIFGFLLVFFLPGFTLVRALFPRKGELHAEYNLLYQIVLGIGLSITLTIFCGIFLNELGINPETNLGYFTAPYICAFLLSLSAIFFVIGWWRGAYPALGKLHPKLYREPKIMEKPVPPLDELLKECKYLNDRLAIYERRVKASNISMRKHYERKIADTKKRLEELNTLIRKYRMGET